MEHFFLATSKGSSPEILARHELPNSRSQPMVVPKLSMLGTVQFLFYKVADAKHNGANTFCKLVQSWVNTFHKADIKALAFCKLKMKFEITNCSF